MHISFRTVEQSARRILVLTSKILQNISNNIVSEGKEQYMQQMNSFVREQAPRIAQYFARLAVRIIFFNCGSVTDLLIFVCVFLCGLDRSLN